MGIIYRTNLTFDVLVFLDHYPDDHIAFRMTNLSMLGT